MKLRFRLLPAALALLTTTAASIRLAAEPEPLDFAALQKGGKLTVHNRDFAAVALGERSAVQFDARPGDGLAWLNDGAFATGVIECDIQGRNRPGASFVGLAFHGLNANTFEAVYFRPFNFASADPARRAHSVQYISAPEHDWSDLRQSHPGVYESDLTPAPDPEAWLHARIIVEARRVSVFVNSATEPCLVVERIPDHASGWVGLWVGNGSDGMFANLKITPDEQATSGKQ